MADETAQPEKTYTVWDEPLAPLMSGEEAGFRIAIAANPRDNNPRLEYLDWLDERGDKRADVIRVMEVFEPHVIRAGDTRPVVYTDSTMRQYAVGGGDVIHDGRTLGEHLLEESMLLQPYGHRMRRVTCLGCDGMGKVKMEKEEPLSIYGKPKLFEEKEYEEVECPRCLGMTDEGGLWKRRSGGRKIYMVHPRIDFCRGFITDLWCNSTEVWDHHSRKPSDWLIRAVMWNPIERIHLYGLPTITEATSVEEVNIAAFDYHQTANRRKWSALHLLRHHAAQMASDAIL